MIDDLVARGTSEPYRVFTSRAEHRLLLREDNAELRLREKGYGAGLVKKDVYEAFLHKKQVLEKTRIFFEKTRLNPSEAASLGGEGAIKTTLTLKELLRRPGVTFQDIGRMVQLPLEVEPALMRIIETEIKYEGYIRRQAREARRSERAEALHIPEDFSYEDVYGLSREGREKLSFARPLSIGQAGRIPGITPAAISAILIHMKKTGAL